MGERDERLEHLTPRDREIIREYLSGAASEQEIGRRLNIDHASVRGHLKKKRVQAYLTHFMGLTFKDVLIAFAIRKDLSDIIEQLDDISASSDAKPDTRLKAIETKEKLLSKYIKAESLEDRIYLEIPIENYEMMQEAYQKSESVKKHLAELRESGGEEAVARFWKEFGDEDYTGEENGQSSDLFAPEEV